MTKKEIINIGTNLGLTFEQSAQSTIDSDVVIFNGYNGDQYVFYSTMKPREIYTGLGDALKEMGKIEFQKEITDLFNEIQIDGKGN